MTDIAATLSQRANTHGDYSDHARVTQEIKRALKSGPSWAKCFDHERETLEMIAHKLGRIVSGDPHFHDHWHDIAGYATLSANRNDPAAPRAVPFAPETFGDVDA